MARFDLSDAEWRIIHPLLPNKPRGVPRTDDRRVLNAIFYVLRTGSPWRDLPERFGSWRTLYSRFRRWQQAHADAAGARDGARHVLNSTTVRAHQHAAGAPKGAATKPSAAPAAASRPRSPSAPKGTAAP